MALVLDGSLGVTFPVTAGSASAVQASSGRVLQVVNAGSNGTSTTSTSFVDTGLTASITPSSSSSKVFVMVNGVSRATNARAGFAIVRNSTQLVGLTEVNGTNAHIPYSFSYLDSPTTTSSVTYKLQIASNTSGQTVNNSDAGTVSSGNINYITLMEIAA